MNFCTGNIIHLYIPLKDPAIAPTHRTVETTESRAIVVPKTSHKSRRVGPTIELHNPYQIIIQSSKTIIEFLSKYLIIQCLNIFINDLTKAINEKLIKHVFIKR